MWGRGGTADAWCHDPPQPPRRPARCVDRRSSGACPAGAASAPATSATGSPTAPTAATRLDVVSDTAGDSSAERGHGDRGWAGDTVPRDPVMARGWGHCLGTLCHGAGLGTLHPRTPWHDTILGTLMAPGRGHCTQGPCAMAPCWGHCAQALCDIALGWGPCAGSLPPGGATLETCHRTRLGITSGTLSPSWTGETVTKNLSLAGSGVAVAVSPSSSGATWSRQYRWR